MRSNCLIQAIKHRLEKGCPVYQVIPHDHDGRIHFVWWDADLYKYRHFTWYKPVKLPKFPYFTIFDGYIDDFDYPRNLVRLRLVF